MEFHGPPGQGMIHEVTATYHETGAREAAPVLPTATPMEVQPHGIHDLGPVAEVILGGHAESIGEPLV
jgi:hypothetical protein